MGWSSEKEVRYYSEFLGLSDEISDEDMVTTEEKSQYEKRIEALEKERQQMNNLAKKLIKRIEEIQQNIVDR